MSETISKLHRALSQAQTFAKEAPLEALARAQLVVRHAELALKGSDPLGAEERAELEELHAVAVSRVSRYEAQVAGWDQGVRNRAALFHTHEVERLQRPIAAKI